MSCNCNETTKQGKQYCQECMPDEFHWLVPVSKEPDPFLMDRNHAYIDPNNIIYVLSRDRLRAIKITTSEGNIDLSPYALKEELASKISELTTKLTEGLEGAKYFEGEGIRIDEDNRIHSTVTLTEVNQRLDSLEQVDTSPYKAGTGIEITPDLTIKSTVDVSGLDSRVQDLEEQEDKDTKYTAGAGLQLNGTEFSVNPNDLPGTDQLVDINERVTALENDTDENTTYTAGNGLILSGTEFSIDDSKVATQQELEETNTRLTSVEAKDLEQDNRLTELEGNGQTQEQLYNVSTHTLVHNFLNGAPTFNLDVKEKNEDGKVFGHLTFKYIDQSEQTIVHIIPLSQVNEFDNYVIQHDNYIYTVQSLVLSQETLEPSGYTIKVDTNIDRFMGSLVLNSVLYRETPNTDNEHIATILEADGGDS